jgi:hypothetical protein
MGAQPRGVTKLVINISSFVTFLASCPLDCTRSLCHLESPWDLPADSLLTLTKGK